mgnify:CR=1 FL=1
MGLMICEDCGREHSDKAFACPQCARPNEKVINPGINNQENINPSSINTTNSNDSKEELADLKRKERERERKEKLTLLKKQEIEDLKNEIAKKKNSLEERRVNSNNQTVNQAKEEAIKRRQRYEENTDSSKKDLVSRQKETTTSKSNESVKRNKPIDNFSKQGKVFATSEKFKIHRTGFFWVGIIGLIVIAVSNSKTPQPTRRGGGGYQVAPRRVVPRAPAINQCDVCRMMGSCDGVPGCGPTRKSSCRWVRDDIYGTMRWECSGY